MCRAVNCQSNEEAPGGEVSSSMGDPNGTRNLVTRHPPPSNSATDGWGSLGCRVFIQKDVLQMCLKWLGLLLHKTLEGDVFQMFHAVQHSTWMPLVLYQEVT